MKFELVLNLTKMIEIALFVDGSKFHLSALSVSKSSSIVMGCLSTAVQGGSWDNGPGDPYLLGLFSHKQKATKAHRPKQVGTFSAFTTYLFIYLFFDQDFFGFLWCFLYLYLCYVCLSFGNESLLILTFYRSSSGLVRRYPSSLVLFDRGPEFGILYKVFRIGCYHQPLTPAKIPSRS